MARYRYVFLAHPDDERALAAFEFFAGSVELAYRLAVECLSKSGAAVVEVGSDGQMILHINSAPDALTKVA